MPLELNDNGLIFCNDNGDVELQVVLSDDAKWVVITDCWGTESVYKINAITGMYYGIYPNARFLVILVEGDNRVNLQYDTTHQAELAYKHLRKLFKIGYNKE